MAKSKQSILVVEDEQYLRELYVQILKKKGYEVTDAVDGADAFEKMSSERYDLVLLDVILPKMDGLQVLDKLSKKEGQKYDNIVLLTNLGQDLVVAKALDFGVKGYMIKSDYTPEEMLKEVEGYLENTDVKSRL